MEEATFIMLREARNSFRKNAATIAARKAAKGFISDDEKQMIIAFGTAQDCLRWASSMSDITFSTKREHTSARRAGLVEATRFLQVWTAANAVFSKDSIIALAHPNPTKALLNSELRRFEVLYAFAKIPDKREREFSQILEKLLGMYCEASDVTIKIKNNDTPTMWEVIDQKYMTPYYRTHGSWKPIHSALEAGKVPKVILTDVIYLARNWGVHGALATSFFRGSKWKYITFVSTLTRAIAEVLHGTSTRLQSLL